MQYFAVSSVYRYKKEIKLPIGAIMRRMIFMKLKNGTKLSDE